MLKLKLKPDPDQAPPSPPPKEDVEAPAKPVRLSLNLEQPSKPMRIRLRTNEGYDAEAPDREDDPVIEEAIVLRMLPGVPELDTLHRAYEKNDLSGLQIRWDDRRRAVVTIDGISFAAQLMDLPTVTEVHKTFDRKNIFKTVDVSQILLVTHKVGDPAPDMSDLSRFTNDPTAYPHGLTPPLYNVRNRRFQKHLSNKAIENLEAQVDELLAKDALAKEVKTELLPASAVAAQQALAEAAKAAAARVNESDMDVDDDLDEELERVMMDTDAAEGENDEDVSASGSGSGSDDDDDGSDASDDGAREHSKHSKQLKEEIKELQATIEAKERVAGNVINDIMRARHTDAVTRLRAELEKKQSLLEDAEEEEEAEDAEIEPAKPDEDEEDDEDEGDDEQDEEQFNTETADRPPSSKPAKRTKASSARDVAETDPRSGEEDGSEQLVAKSPGGESTTATMKDEVGQEEEEDDIDDLF